MQATEAVEGIPCPCPGTPHPDGDTVYLRSKLGLRAGATLQNLVIVARNRHIASVEEGAPVPDMTPLAEAELTAELTEGYILMGVVDWTFTDPDGRKVPVHADTIRALLLEDFGMASAVADRADELYMPAVIGPLVKAAEPSSQDITTDESTSPTTSGAPPDPTPLRQSSITTTPMDDIETTYESLAGVS